MPRGRKTALHLHLTVQERATLYAWQRSPTLPAGLVRRGRIILLLAEGWPITHIGPQVGISRRFVYKWAKRFLTARLMGLYDAPGRGRPRQDTKQGF